MTPTKAALWLQLVEFFTPGRKPFLFDEGAVAIQMLAPSGAETEDELRLINSVGNFILVPRSVRVTSGSFAELKKLLPSRAEMVIYPTSVSAFKYASWDLATISARNDEISKLAAKAFRTSM